MTAAVYAKSKQAQSKRYYRAKILSAKKEAYVGNAEELKSEAKASYQANPNGKKAASKAHYSFDPEKKKASSRATVCTQPSNLIDMECSPRIYDVITSHT